MKIAELVARQGNVDIELEVTEKGDVREFSKFGKPGRVCTVVCKDDAGDTVKASLWNEQVDKVDVGSKIAFKNGYCSEWQGEKQISTGREGTLEMLSESE